MVSVYKYLACIDKNVSRIKEYLLGHDGSDGKSDCIGLIIGAYRLSGMSWNGTHGSNYAARNMMQDGLTKLTTSNLFLGEIVYKAKSPGDSGYAMPDKYRSSGDLNDYFHVGIVTSVNPLMIKHCTGVQGGIARDTKLGKWKYGGKLKGIDYNNKEVTIVIEKAKVYGGSLNFRAEPSYKANKICSIPNGTIVDVIEHTNDEFWKITYGGKTGYVMRQYLALDEGETQTISISRDVAQTFYEALKAALNA